MRKVRDGNMILFPKFIEQHLPQKLLIDREYTHKLYENLLYGSKEEQWLALEQLAFFKNEQTIDRLRVYLKMNDRDGAGKTYALMILKSFGVEGKVVISKSGKECFLSVESVPCGMEEFSQAEKR
jgi:hypothetical protein